MPVAAKIDQNCLFEMSQDLKILNHTTATSTMFGIKEGIQCSQDIAQLRYLIKNLPSSALEEARDKRAVMVWTKCPSAEPVDDGVWSELKFS